MASSRGREQRIGFRSGRKVLLDFLFSLRSMGVHHVILNLKYGARSAGEVLEEIGSEVLPQLKASQPASASAATHERVAAAR